MLLSFISVSPAVLRHKKETRPGESSANKGLLRQRRSGSSNMQLATGIIHVQAGKSEKISHAETLVMISHMKDARQKLQGSRSHPQLSWITQVNIKQLT